MTFGDKESAKSGTPRVTKAGDVPIPPELVPVTTTSTLPLTNVDAFVELSAVTVNVEVPAPVIEVGLTVAVTPAGAPRTFAVRAMFPVKPFSAASEIVAVWLAPPGVTFRVFGEADSVKYALVPPVGASALIMP